MFKVRNEVLQKYNNAITLSHDPINEKIQVALDAIQVSQIAFSNYYREQGLWGKIFQIIDKITGKGSKLNALLESLRATQQKTETRKPTEKATTLAQIPEKVNSPSQPINTAEQTPEVRPATQENKPLNIEEELFSLDITRIEACRVHIEAKVPTLSFQEKMDINSFIAKALIKLLNFSSPENYKSEEFLSFVRFQKVIGTTYSLHIRVKPLIIKYMEKGNFSKEEKEEANKAFGLNIE